MRLHALGQVPIFASMPHLLEHSTWVQHVPFAMHLMATLRPSVFVELGTYRGVSYCACCQAVKELGLDTKCYGIDTWSGDDHTGSYDNSVYEGLSRYHEPLYGRFSTLVRSTFDEALPHFSDGTVDLLHLDGLHTYEAVRHDFEMWLPKMSSSGVIMVHDTNVRERGFGVWRFWQEVRSEYPFLEFVHGHGLGILAVGRSQASNLVGLFSLDGPELVNVQELFHQLGWRIELFQEVRDLSVLVEEYRSTAEMFNQVWSHRSIRALYYFHVEGARGILGRLAAHFGVGSPE